MQKKKSLFESAFRRSISNEKIRLVKEADEGLAAALEDGSMGDMGSSVLGADDRSLENEMNIDSDYQSNSAKVQNQKVQKALDQQNAAVDDIIITWVDKLEGFVKFLNDPEEHNSIRYIINNAIPGTMLDKISGPDQRRLNKIATETAALAQAFRTYIGGVKDN